MIFRGSNLYKKRGRKEAVRGVSIEVCRGEVVGLLGPNGAGKTTTFYLLAGVLHPDRGEISLGGEDITHLPLYLRARKGIAYLPQEHTLFEDLSLEENLQLVLEFYPFLKGELKKEEVMERMGLLHIKNTPAGKLSGGEKRKMEIARLLILSPKFLLLDEPFTGIDPRGVEEIKAIILQLKEKGIGILLTDHNVRDSLQITDRAYIIFNGEIGVEGGRDEILSHPRAIEEYLGKSFLE
ncbi:MAG: LPS export ABC transporter ATP-binding protein [Caldiserica bacterium]|nr:LPS export ABC transporter ATP-binding protein [Caldisericota bacterium]